MYALTSKFNLKKTFPNKVSIWKLRTNSPMRKTFISKDISFKDFLDLIKLASETSKPLYPYIRAILSSRDYYTIRPQLWDDFKTRFLELMNERLNTESIRVKKLLDPKISENIYIKILLNLSLCISEDGYFRLKDTLLNL